MWRVERGIEREDERGRRRNSIWKVVVMCLGGNREEKERVKKGREKGTRKVMGVLDEAMYTYEP